MMGRGGVGQSNSSNGEVAIVIPAFNAEATIERAVRSALAQTADVCVIAVDDASQDRTPAILNKLAAQCERLSVIHQSANTGPSAARNAAIAMSSSRWIAPLDADDVMMPGRIASLIGVAERGAWDFVADDIYKLPEDVAHDPSLWDAARSRLWSPRELGCEPVSLYSFVRGNISANRPHRCEMGFVKPLIRRAFLDEHALSYDEAMRLGEDYDLYARALAAGARFCLVDPRGYYAVERASSLSTTTDPRGRGGLVGADRRLLANRGLDAKERSIIEAHQLEAHKEWVWLRMIDAVKSRNIAAAATCFVEPPHVVVSLIGRLGWQTIVRTSRMFGIGDRREAGLAASDATDAVNPVKPSGL